MRSSRGDSLKMRVCRCERGWSGGATLPVDEREQAGPQRACKNEPQRGPYELSQRRLPCFWQRYETTGWCWPKRWMWELGKRSSWRESLRVSSVTLGSRSRLRIPSQLLVWTGEEDLWVTSTNTALARMGEIPAAFSGSSTKSELIARGNPTPAVLDH